MENVHRAKRSRAGLDARITARTPSGRDQTRPSGLQLGHRRTSSTLVAEVLFAMWKKEVSSAEESRNGSQESSAEAQAFNQMRGGFDSRTSSIANIQFVSNQLRKQNGRTDRYTRKPRTSKEARRLSRNLSSPTRPRLPPKNLKNNGCNSL